MFNPYDTIMILLFCLYLLSARAASVPHATGENISSSCTTLDHCRTLWSIVWSSLTTIGLCTWGALHPNIPPPCPDEEEKPAGYWKSKECWIGWAKKCKWRIRVFMKERVVLFVVALLVPEYILAWAIRQNLKAREIVKEGFVKEDHDLQVSQVHGFFIVMGGFHLYKTHIINSNDGEGRKKRQELGIPLHPLDDRAVWTFINDGKVNLPTADEIQDRGKSDWLAKALVIFQTLWFVMQCIARGIKHLPLSELEVVALAYTTINIGIYIAWWNKPRGIYHPIRVIDSVMVEERGNVASEDQKEELPTKLEAGGESNYSNESRVTSGKRLDWEALLEALLNLLVRVFSYIAGGQDNDVTLETVAGVPTFWAGGASGNDDRIVVISDSLALVVGIAFGAVHCIAWSFPFPSHRALIMWRLSAAAIAGIPVLISIAIAGAYTLQRADDIEVPSWWQNVTYWGRNVVKKVSEALVSAFLFLLIIVCLVSAPLYVVARATTLVLAFTTLKDLPMGAYQTVQWTSFVPHI